MKVQTGVQLIHTSGLGAVELYILADSSSKPLVAWILEGLLVAALMPDWPARVFKCMVEGLRG